jgi:prevent-host-death family protein
MREVQTPEAEAHLPRILDDVERGETAVITRHGRPIARLPVDADRSPDEAGILALARQHRLAVYDAAYLELARREGLPLASPGKALRKAAAASEVALLGG